MRPALTHLTIIAALLSGAIKAQTNPECSQTTVGQLAAQNNTTLFNGILGTTGASIAVLALGKAKPIVWVGALTVLLKELKDLSASYDQKTQLDAMPNWDKSTRIQVCPASDWMKTTLGFRDLKVIALKLRSTR